MIFNARTANSTFKIKTHLNRKSAATVPLVQFHRKELLIMAISETADIMQNIAKSGQEEQEFNIIKDLKALERINFREFKPAIKQMIKKYESDENTLVHAALMKKCAAGDMAAIKMYHELQSAGTGSESEVRIIDDI
ncbi:MAG: hypothetical protein RR234_01030 [Christensenella sp.]